MPIYHAGIFILKSCFSIRNRIVILYIIYQLNVPKTSLRCAPPSPDHHRLLRAKRIGKETYFSATLRQCFQINMRDLVAQLHLTTDASS